MKHRIHQKPTAWGIVCVVATGLAIIFGQGCRSEKPSPEDSAKQPSADKAAATPASTDVTIAKDATAQGVLQSMVKAYKSATSYADAGQIRMTGQLGEQPIDERYDMVLAMVRPNKIRLHAYQGIVVCDGEKLRAYVAGIPNQVLERPAPAEMTIKSIFTSSILADSMAQGATQDFTWVPLQTLLMMADDPLKTLLYSSSQVRLIESAKIDEQPCYRVEVTRPDGKAVFWIDPKSFVLRRLEYPTQELKKLLAGGRVENLSLVADFTTAQINQEVDPNAFQFVVPPKTARVDELTPPGILLLGKPSRDFSFVGADNKPVTMKSLAGKIAVLDFWASWSEPCRKWLPELDKAFEKFKDNDKVAFLAVNTDDQSVSDADLRTVLDELKFRAPIFRDPQHQNETSFDVTDIPTTVILGPDGVVEAYEAGPSAGGAADLVRQIERLLAGEHIHAEKPRMFELMKSEYKRIFDEMLKRDLFVSPMAILQQIPQSGIAEKSGPTAMKLSPLWENTELDAPGNILVTPRPDGPPQLFVLHGGKSVAEIDVKGKLIANHVLKVPTAEAVTFLRTDVGADGRRYFVGSAPGMQQFHLFDDKWNTVLSFPPDAHENPHAGVGDVQIADLDGNGMLDLAVGYRGLVGVKGVSLDGKVVWSDRTLANVLRLAADAPDANRQRRLFCTNDKTSLAIIDAQGKNVGKLSLDGRLLYWIAAADLNGDGHSEMCGLCAPKIGDNLALGLNDKGDLLWSYELPSGTPGQLVELVSAAKLLPDGPGQWLLAGVDGSVHLVAIDGKPIDHFNYGALVSGLAATHIDGKPVLLISTRRNLTALAVEWRAK